MEGRRTLKNWARGHSCDIVAKTLASFCSYSKNPSEVRLFHREAPCAALGDQRNVLKTKPHHPEVPPWEDANSLTGRKPTASPISWEAPSQESVPSAHRGGHSSVQRGEAVNRTWLLSLWYLILSHKDVSLRGSLRTAEARPCVARRQALW